MIREDEFAAAFYDLVQGFLADELLQVRSTHGSGVSLVFGYQFLMELQNG